MNTKNVRNITENELVIPEIGVVPAGAIIVVPAEFNNANFEVVKTETKKEVEVATPKKFNSK